MVTRRVISISANCAINSNDAPNATRYSIDAVEAPTYFYFRSDFDSPSRFIRTAANCEFPCRALVI